MAVEPCDSGILEDALGAHYYNCSNIATHGRDLASILIHHRRDLHRRVAEVRNEQLPQDECSAGCLHAASIEEHHVLSFMEEEAKTGECLERACAWTSDGVCQTVSLSLSLSFSISRYLSLPLVGIPL